MSNCLQDLGDVRAVIKLYIHGSNGDVAKLSLRRRSIPMRACSDVPDRWAPASPLPPSEMVLGQPSRAGPTCEAAIRNIDLTVTPRHEWHTTEA